MDFNPVNTDTVKYEMRGMAGDTPVTQEKKKTGFFGRLFSGLLKFVTAPLSVMGAVFPPAGLAAAGTYGLASTIDVAQANSAAKHASQNVAASPQSYFLPGIDSAASSADASSGVQATGSAPTAMQQRVTDVLYARNDAMIDSTAAFRAGGEVAGV